MSKLLKVLAAPIWLGVFIVEAVCQALWPLLKGSWKFMRRQKKASVHGNAGWADDKTLKARGHFTPGGIAVGATRKGRRIYAHPESSVLMIAPKGQGKTQSFVAILKALKDYAKRPDLLIHDPAGDVYRATSADLAAMGYHVAIVDVFDPEAGGRYDPFSFPNPDDVYDFDRDVRAMCELMVPDDADSRQPHFAEFSRILFREVVSAAMRDGNTRTIADCVTDLTDDARRDKLIARLKLLGKPEAMSAITTFAKMAGKPEGNSMLSTSLRKLEVWRLEAVKAVSSFGPTSNPLRPRGWNWDDVFNYPKPVAMFVRTGLGSGGGDFVRVTCGNAINTARRHWNRTGKPLRKGLWLIVDEARAMGNCNAVMDANNELRKAGVNVLLCFLSLADVHKTYPDADTLVAGCELVVFGGSKDADYYNEISKLMGTRTEHSHGESTHEGRKGESRHEIGVPLLRPDELRRLPLDEAVVLMNDLNVRCHKLFKRGKDWIRYL